MIIWLITGFWVILGCAEAAHLVTVFYGGSLQSYTVLMLILAAAGILIYTGIVLGIKHIGRPGAFSAHPWGRSVYMWPFLCLTAVTLYYFVSGYTPRWTEAVYEIVLGNLESGGFFQVNPFTGGELADAAMPLRMRILGLSSFHSGIISLTGIPVYTWMCQIAPAILWGLSMLQYAAFADALYGENGDRKWLFLSFVAFLYLVTAQVSGMPGNLLFYAGFTGEAVRGCLLIPYTVYAAWQKKWVFLLLALLTEMHLVWTTYGAGYCLLAALLVLAARFISDRRKKAC